MSGSILGHNFSPIEELMARKLGTTYEKFRFARDGTKILLKKLKEVLRADVEAMLKQNDQSSPPFDPFKIQKIGNAKINVMYTSRAEIGAEGSLEVSGEDFLIKIDKTLAEEPRSRFRLRSTMAHELMHIFFYETKTLPPAKRGYVVRSRRHYLMEEELCYFLAREFLLPTFSVLELMAKKKSLQTPSLGNVEFLKSTFVVSSDILAYRMISDLSLWDAIFAKFMQTGQMYRSKTKLKNQSNPTYKKIRIPKYVPSDSSATWPSLLSNHIANAAKLGRLEEIVRLDGHLLAIESMVETQNPVCIITIAYEVE